MCSLFLGASGHLAADASETATLRARKTVTRLTQFTNGGAMFFGKLLPHEGNFFEMFNQHADRIVEAARAFSNLVANYSDPHLRQKYNQDVDLAEQAADRVTRDVNKAIHITFITPIDREQIHALINTMDDVADLIQDSAETMALYDVREMTEEIVRLTDVSVRCCERLRDAVGLLSKIADPATAEAALKTCEEIDQLESDADRIMRSAMSKLFREQSDVRELIKLKAIYELLETITDKCEDVANVIEGIVLENS
jgi:predicted phosphate transport protein (TIGR00153 family)